jgi:alpha-tubulin suppressor-like RCC1 family protein
MEKVYLKLNEYFAGNIKLSYKSVSELMIITNEDKVYKIMKNDLVLIALNINEFESIIESSLVPELCGKRIIDFSSGTAYVMALTIDGKIYCWGNNSSGQLGNGLQDDPFDYDLNFQVSNILGQTLSQNIQKKFKPVLNEYLVHELIVQISCGHLRALALTRNGDVYAWGYNEFGVIGIGSDIKFQLIPIKLSGFSGKKVILISSGFEHSLALTLEGHVFSWGRNESGQLGISKSVDFINAPKLIKLPKVSIRKISCGSSHSLLLSSDGDIYAFGKNDYGQIGNGCLRNQLFPAKIDCETKFGDIYAHFGFSFSIACSVNYIYYIFGKFGNGFLETPVVSSYQSFNEINMNLAKISFKPMLRAIHALKSFDSEGLYDEFFESLGEPIGSGSYGTVVKAKLIRSDSIYAVKKMRSIENLENDFIEEFKKTSIIRHLNSELVVKYFNAWPEYENNRLSFYLQMELCDTTLEEIIDAFENDTILKKNETETLTPIGYYVMSQLFIEILEGVNFLHKQTPPIIHRDLKPANILLKRSQNNRYIKIADFGLITIHEFTEKLHDEDVGATKFMAPEVVSGREYDTKADIYSTGILMQHMFDMFDTEK